MSSSGGMDVSGDGTLSQAAIPVFLHHQRSTQPLHDVSDIQVQPTAEVPFVSEELLTESLSAFATDRVSMIMKTRDMLLELYKARIKQR